MAHVEGILAGMIKRAGAHKSSIVADRIEGRATEWDARNFVIDGLTKSAGE
jgi:ketopantoate reductase